MTDKVYVLDTSAIIAGFAPGLIDAQQLTVPEVINEAQTLSAKLKLETAVSLGNVGIEDPPEEAVAEVRDEVAKTGDKVSETDIKILGLAFHLQKLGKDPVVVTDDYAIQNLATLLEITYSQIAQPGITTVLRWKKRCPSCGKTYPVDASSCEVCGSKLRREPVVERSDSD